MHSMNRPQKSTRLDGGDLCAIIVAFSFFVLHARFFGDWIVDDAGISFAYARNLALGHGLVSQPGAPPVEGYSNPLWVFLMAIFIALRSFDPVVTPKVLGGVFVALVFAVAYATFRLLAGGRRSVPFLVLVCTALSTPFVAWAVSGLENSLYVFLICSMFGLAVTPWETEGLRQPIWFALLAICVASTRPDGVIYACVYPLIAVIRGRAEGRPLRELGRNVLRYVIFFASIGLALLAVRFLYFQDLLPNTYYAKGVSAGRSLLVPGQLSSLLDRVTGVGGSLWLLSLVSASLFLTWRNQMRWEHLVSLLFLCLSLLVFLLLPVDWFGEFRFASPFFLFFYGHGLVTAWLLFEDLFSPRLRNCAWVAAAIGVIALGALLNVNRSLRFARDPPLPFSAIEKRARRFDRYASELGIENGSILTPDLGATLYFSRLRIYDLGMLCDRTIARTLGKNPQAFSDYVFEEVKPTFVHTHDLWTCLSRFDEDPRFRRDYLTLHEWRNDAWVFEGSSIRMLPSGDYVRRDAIRDRTEQVRRIQGESNE